MELSSDQGESVVRNDDPSSLSIIGKDFDMELLLKQITEMVVSRNGLLSGHHRMDGCSDRIVQFYHPETLKELVDLSLGDAVCQDTLIDLCQKTIDFSVRTCSPKFLNQLYHGADPVGLAGSWLSSALNTNSYTFEIAPFFTMVEHEVLKHLRKFVGWNEGDGIFAPGGSISNMYGMVLARYHKFPEIKTKGLASVGQLVAFTSQEGHYSLAKAAHWIGLGTENLIEVATDDSGQMIPSELEKAIKQSTSQGKKPFFVNATCGTTVLGAFDPLEPLTDICSENNLWLHVDAAWGGAALVSNKHRHLLRGIERVDSVAWNLHKMLGAPLQCSAFLTKHKDLLHHCNSASATYLFQQDKFYDVGYDTGDKSVQCGRKVDAFKLWLMWKARGDEGLERLVDNAFQCAAYLARRIADSPGFRPVLSEINYTNVCFWYVPNRLRNCPETQEWWNELSKIAPLIKKRMVEKGSLIVSYQPLGPKKWVNFFRVVITCQPSLTKSDMEFIISEIDTLGLSL